MRLFSLLPMILAAILLAGSVSAHHKCGKNKSLGGKVYEVCKSWRADQGGPMPTDEMQHCRNLLCQYSEDSCGASGSDEGQGDGTNFSSTCVSGVARTNTKNELGYWPYW